MPEPTMQELLNQLESRQLRSANHSVLIDALREYDSQTKAFRQLRGRKKLPFVTARDKTRLMELHKAVGAAADSVLGNEGESEELKEIVRKITALSSANYNALVQYDPAKNPKTLSSLEEDVRTLTIHQGNVVLGGADAMGGAQSERAPLSFLDDKGKRISGLFTKKRVLEPEKMLADAFAELTNDPFFRDRKDAEAVTWLRDNIIEVLRNVPDLRSRLGENAKDNDYLAALINLCTAFDDEDNPYIDPVQLKNQLGDAMSLTGKYDENSLREITWNKLAKAMKPMIAPLRLAYGVGKIPAGGRIDNRNAAMSAVADLLGMPSVIARSKPMRIIDKDGNVVEGTFMEASKGMDSENLPPEAARIKSDCLKGTNGKGFKDIANLQVLDYLCGNFDRHAANMHYLFDKNGKLCGVQGIDNDSCFGVLTPEELKDTGKNHNRMTNLANLKVMSKATRDRVMALDASTLKYALRGYGLSEKELDAAGKRLERMQKYIRAVEKSDAKKPEKQKALRIMTDSQFKSASIESLCKIENQGEYYNMQLHGNTFNIVRGAAPNLAAYRSEQVNLEHREYRDLKKATEVGMDNRAERHVPGRERIKGSSLETILNKRTWSAWTSNNYIAMQRAVKNYVNTYKTIEERLKQANDEENKRLASYHHEKEAVVSEADLERMRSASEQMRDAAWNYLRGKMPELVEWELDGEQPIPYPEGASDYTKRRIDAAADVYRMSKQGDTIKEVESQTARDNEREAEAAQRRREKERSPEAPQDHIVAI